MEESWDGIDRRQTPKNKDMIFRLVNVGNIIVWVIFVAALVIFHYARPETISGVQRYWGVSGRQEWNEVLTLWLLGLLAVCTLLSTVLIFMRKQRNRRKNESWWSNLLFLGAVSGAFALWVLQIVV